MKEKRQVKHPIHSLQVASCCVGVLFLLPEDVSTLNEDPIRHENEQMRREEKHE